MVTDVLTKAKDGRGRQKSKEGDTEADTEAGVFPVLGGSASLGTSVASRNR